MTSIFPIAYGFSKFASGVLGARTSPTLLLGGGLMATALVNITFGFGASMTWWGGTEENSANWGSGDRSVVDFLSLYRMHLMPCGTAQFRG